MPVTINNLSSTVSMVDGAGGAMPPEMIEQIVRIVLERLREEQSVKKEQQIPDRMSESTDF